MYEVRCSLNCQHELRHLGSAHQRLDPVGDPPSLFAKLSDGPVGRVVFGEVIGAGVVDQPLGRRGGRQHRLALGDADEAVPQAVEPEFGATGLADAGVEMMWVLDMTGRARRRGEHLVANMSQVIAGLGQVAFENGRKLSGVGAGASGRETGGPTMLGSCGRSGHHRDILAGDALWMHQILAINQRVETEQTEISIECRYRWLRAPAIRYRSKFARRRLVENRAKGVRRIRDGVTYAWWRQTRSIKDVNLDSGRLRHEDGRGEVRSQVVKKSQKNYAISRPRFVGRAHSAERSKTLRLRD